MHSAAAAKCYLHRERNRGTSKQTTTLDQKNTELTRGTRHTHSCTQQQLGKTFAKRHKNRNRNKQNNARNSLTHSGKASHSLMNSEAAKLGKTCAKFVQLGEQECTKPTTL